MIIYGRKAKILATETLAEKCPNCGAAATLQLSIVQKYLHVFWVPFVPIGKTAVSKCGNCKQILKEKEMPASISQYGGVLKRQAKTPLYMFSGLAIVAIIVALAVVEGIQDAQKSKLLISAPQRGDIFEVKTAENQYTLYKVYIVAGDTVTVHPNQYETDAESGLGELKDKGDTAYATLTMQFSKADLKGMLDKGEIIKVERK